MTEFIEKGEIVPCRSFRKIISNYLRTMFILDFIAVFPIQFIIPHELNKEENKVGFYKYVHWCYILKVIRIYDGSKLLNVNKIMRNIRKWLQAYLDHKIQNDPNIVYSIDKDYNNNWLFIIISYSLKTFKLILIIVNLTYFMGLFYFFYCEVVDEIWAVSHDPDDKLEGFMDIYFGHGSEHK